MTSLHNTVLAKAFVTDPSTYRFTYQTVSPTGTSCACGHFIKNVFTVVNPNGHTVNLGSECINTYKELDHVVAEIKALAEAEKKRLELEQDEKFQSLYEKARNLSSSIHKLIDNRVFLDRELFISRDIPSTTKFKMLKTKIKKLEEYVAFVEPLVLNHSEDMKQIDIKKLEQQEHMKKIEDQLALSKHVGALKERLILEVEVVFQKDFEGAAFGGGTEMKRVTTFKLGENILTTFTFIPELEKGSVVKITGTVCRHGHYEGQSRTSLNRVKVL